MVRAYRCFVVLTGTLTACAAGGRAETMPITMQPDAQVAPSVDAGTVQNDVTLPADAGHTAPVDPREQPGECGDGVCNVDETCAACSPDCGRCPVCDLAPSCTGSVAVPSSGEHLAAFDNGERSIYTSGVDDQGIALGTPLEQTDCIAPELRMRVRQINVVRDGVPFGTADLYCVVNASDGVHSEVMITPLQPNVGDDSPPLLFQPEASMFWGQGMPWQTLSNLTITYQCFRAVSNESYTRVFDAIQSGATSAGGIAGPWGWAFGAGSVAAGLISAAIPKGQDESRVNVQQTIDGSMLLDLTNGRRWQIRGTGDAPGIGGYWDWSMEIESWGCSNARAEIE